MQGAIAEQYSCQMIHFTSAKSESILINLFFKMDSFLWFVHYNACL
ncbi:hypothetical protein QY97_02685 [Bacillus thermotolerans]|uniref:Uncharacterized protein n=1 Tax=Bacillus thermotolerans TaxID=1221996 RepID=A0A0F5HQB7_BACTR|nr:hypothetical protein QY97_02685 [Bacillus thermotolerans]KKB35235.1 hypothetical protein QY95_03524 [Bacillus thermotolerans]